MKKIILSTVIVGGLTVCGFGQGILLQDNSGAVNDTTINGVANFSQDLNLELLVGTSPTSITTDEITLLLSDSTVTTSSAPGGTSTAAGDISAAGGYIYDSSAVAYSLASFAGETISVEVEAWTGNFSSYAAASAQGSGAAFGTSQVFTAAVPATANGFPIDASGVGVINLTTAAVPEPGTMALAGLGSLSLFLLRRKK
jgi:hypothetical protein